MKKVLFATTALVMTAGVAAAEVTVGGDGRMGVIYDGADWAFTSRIRISFTASGETDGGLQFGGSVRADHYNTDLADGDTTTATNGTSGSVYISGAFGKLSMGDVDSAAEAAVGDVSGVGLTGLGDLNELTYIGDQSFYTNPAVLYEYSAGDLTLYAGLGNPGTFDTNAYSVGARYSMGDYAIGIAYENDDFPPVWDMWSIGGQATFGDVTVKAVYGDHTTLGSQYAMSVDATFGATTVTAFYRDGDTPVDAAMGLGMSYDLGGGASLKGGVVDDGTDTTADFGVSFSF